MKRNNKGQFKRLTNEEFLNRMNNISNNIEIISEYKGTLTDVTCKCKICKNEWKTKAKNLLRGNGCPKCNKSNPKIDTVEYKKQLAKINKNINIVGEYNGNAKRIKCNCKECGYEWSPFASALKQGHGCPNCKSLNNRLSKEEFYVRVKINNPNFEILGEYETMSTPIEVKCLKCGKVIKTLPNYLIYGKNVCKECYKITLLKTDKCFKEELFSKNPYIVPIEKYKGVNIKIKVKCSICGYVWKANPSNILNGTGCPICNLSHGEKEIQFILDKFNIKYEIQKQFIGLVGTRNKPLSYDFYLPEYNILIEYQGKQHEQPIKYFGAEAQFKIQQEHDRRKKNML